MSLAVPVASRLSGSFRRPLDVPNALLDAVERLAEHDQHSDKGADARIDRPHHQGYPRGCGQYEPEHAGTYTPARPKASTPGAKSCAEAS